MHTEDLMILRAEIDRIDEELIRIFERRIRAVEKIAEYKRFYKLPARDEKRRREKLQAVRALSANEGDKDVIETLYKYIISLFEEVQNSRLRDNTV